MLLRLVIAYSCVFFRIIGFIANAKEILEQFVANLTMLLLVSLRYDASFLRCVVLGRISHYLGMLVLALVCATEMNSSREIERIEVVKKKQKKKMTTTKKKKSKKRKEKQMTKRKRKKTNDKRKRKNMTKQNKRKKKTTNRIE